MCTLMGSYVDNPGIVSSPDPNPLMTRNGPVNQVKFLGLAQTFASLSPSNIQNILRQSPLKKGILVSVPDPKPTPARYTRRMRSRDETRSQRESF